MLKQKTVCALVTILAVTGCGSGKAGGPGATNTSGGSQQRADVSKVKETEQKVLGATKDTIMIDVPMMSTKLKPGETAPVEIGIDRGKHMDGDITLAFSGLPSGISIDPASPILRSTDTKTSVTVKADPSAAAGEYTVNVNAHPPTGVDATNFLKIVVDRL